MKKGEKLTTNEARVKKIWAKGNTCKDRYISKTLDLLKLICKKPSSRTADICNLQYLLSVVTVTPFSHK